MVRRNVLLIKTGELKVLLRRLFIAVLFFCSIFFILLSTVNSPLTSGINKAALRITGPIMQVVEYPARIVHRAYTYLYDISRIYIDNRELRAENKQMLILQNKVRSLEVENQLLSRLLNYVPPPEANFISAKIIAESGDNFTHILFIYIGNEDVKKGQIVLGDESVIGRIDAVSGSYAIVILVTDINTSGVGGMFPAGLPIGFVSSAQNNEIKVETLADISRIEYVRIVDYGLTAAQVEIFDASLESAKHER